MNRTVLAVIALAVILAIAAYLFYASAPGTETAIENNVDQMTAPSAPPATTPP